MSKIKFHKGGDIPLELHRVRIVQKINLLPIDERLEAIKKADYNTYNLESKDVFLDMLTDSGTNAMSDVQLGAMMTADDAYAGSQTYYKLCKAVEDVIGKKYTLPVHQGRAAENVLARTFVKEGDIIPMNYHFGSTISHIGLAGGTHAEMLYANAFESESTNQFKGNVEIDKLIACIEKHGADKIPFIRMEASTNLIGGQPFSVENYLKVRDVATKYKIKLVLDASLLGENALLVKQREEKYANCKLGEIIMKICDAADIVYFSARKLTSSKGGAICSNDRTTIKQMEAVVGLFEGYVTSGGISMNEMESMAVGLYETLDENVISQSPSYIKYFVEEAVKRGIPMITPPGVLGAHIDARRFCAHLPKEEYQAAALASALYITSGVRAMEGGSVSEVNPNNPNYYADMELVRLAFPRRVFTLSQTLYALDRLEWLYENKNLIGGMKFIDVPGFNHNFRSPLAPLSDWPNKLIAKFKKDFGDSL